MIEFLEELDRVSSRNIEKIMKALGYDPEETEIFATCVACGEQQAANADEGTDFICPECGGTKFRLEFYEAERDMDDEEDDGPIIAKGIECFYMKAYEQRMAFKKQQAEGRNPSGKGAPKENSGREEKPDQDKSSQKPTTNDT